jgi:predicted AlkP superfamily phosphohydrolase/phosphomutase
MRFLRMLTNSLLAGALGAAYLTVLVLQLNPHIPLLSSSAGRWFLTFGLFYGLHLAALFYVLTVARDFFTLDDLSPGWASVRVLAWLSAAAAAAAAVLMWLNVDGLASALDDVTARRMRAGAAATTASAIALLMIAIAHYSFGRRGSRVGAALFVLAVVGSLALPLAARGPAVAAPAALGRWSSPVEPVDGRAEASADESGSRVTMVLLDGASLEYVWMRVSEGRLPNFARMLETGAWLDLATIRPTQPDPVWAAAATGMYSVRNGVRSAATYVARRDWRAVDLLPDHCFSYFLVHLGVVDDHPRTSASWTARPLWNILSDAGISVGVVRWPLTYPAPHVHGFVVSDRFHEKFGSMSEFEPGGTYPANLLAGSRTALVEDSPDGLDTIPTAASTPERSAAHRDRLYSRVLGALGGRETRFTAVRYQSLDTVGHRYLQYARTRDAADVPEQQRRQFTQVLDRAYSAVDAEIGRVIGASAPGDLVLVVSGFGMQRLNPLKQVVGRLLGDADIKSTHERAPDGFLLAFGTNVAAGRRQRGSIVDVAPTVLYYLGLPVGRDMDGYARTDLFTRAFTAPRPIAFIPTYSK